MKNNKINAKNSRDEHFYLPEELRERLRQRAVACSARLDRAVARRTSADPLPCPEYGEEVARQFALAEELFHIQYCRTALERCIDCGAASLRYHRANGAQVRTVFRMTERGLVQVTGLPQPCDAEKELLQNCSSSIRQTGRQT